MLRINIDPKGGLKMNYCSAMDYIESHRLQVSRFLDSRIRPQDFDFVLQDLCEKPEAFAKTLQLNFGSTEERVREIITEEIIRPGTITVQLGAKRHGKTASLFEIFEFIHLHFPHKKLFWYGCNPEITKVFPWIYQTYDLKDIVEDTVLGFDESAIFMNSRNAMSRENKELVDELPTIGHRDASLIFMSQSAQMVDPSIFRMADFIWFKPFYQFDFDERINMPRYLKYIIPQDKNENLIHSLETGVNYIYKNGLPIGWNDKLSKPFRRITSQKEAEELFDMLIKAGMSPNNMRKIFRIRGWDPDSVM